VARQSRRRERVGRSIAHAIVALVVLFGLGCGASNVKAHHTGKFDGRSPVVDLGTCCVGYDPSSKVAPVYNKNRKLPTLWWPVVDAKGTPWPAGHRHDAYFTGDKINKTRSKRPANYRYTPGPNAEAGRFAVDLARLYPKLKTVDFREFQSHEDGGLTEEGKAEVKEWLRARYGADSTVKRLGAGGFSVAYRVCRRANDCLVVKIRKMTPTFAGWKRIRYAVDAATELKRDLAIAEVARNVTSWTAWVDKSGQPVPFKIDGKALPTPSGTASKPSRRLARAAGFTNASLLSDGAVEQVLIAFPSNPTVDGLLAQAANPASELRKQANVEAGANRVVSASEINEFFDQYSKLSRIGPEVIKVDAFFQSCRRFAGLPTVAGFCVTLRRSFAIPDDFNDRVAALEWMYRDSAADVIRFTRRNFGRALGNPAPDGLFREVGLDFNHGRNAGWDPASRQFVLFDF